MKKPCSCLHGLKTQTFIKLLIKELRLDATFRKSVGRVISDLFELVFKIELISLLEANGKEPQL